MITNRIVQLYFPVRRWFRYSPESVIRCSAFGWIRNIISFFFYSCVRMGISCERRKGEEKDCYLENVIWSNWIVMVIKIDWSNAHLRNREELIHYMFRKLLDPNYTIMVGRKTLDVNCVYSCKPNVGVWVCGCVSVMWNIHIYILIRIKYNVSISLCTSKSYIRLRSFIIIQIIYIYVYISAKLRFTCASIQ